MISNSILLIAGIASLLPLPLWVLKRAKQKKSYLFILFAVAVITVAAFYFGRILENNQFETAALLAVMTVIYGIATCLLTLAFLFFGLTKHKGYQARYEALRQRRYETLRQGRKNRQHSFVFKHNDDEENYDIFRRMDQYDISESEANNTRLYP